MILSLLSESPVLFFAWVVAIVTAITIHEFSHGAIAYLLGDNTAKTLGRLTLNPLRHLDPVGTLMLLVIGFGWGRPMPFNPLLLRWKRGGEALVAFAGPFSNLILATIFGILLRVFVQYQLVPADNMVLEFFGLIVLINLMLLVFNLIPIPPLDGSKILFEFLPSSLNNLRFNLERYGPMILIGLLLVDNLLGLNIFAWLFSSITRFVFGFLGNIS